MDHKQIEQFDLINRYLMGKLLAEESASFEEHFVDCQQCIAQLQTTSSFVRDLRMAASEQASQLGSRQPRITLWHALQKFLPRPLAWAAGLLLIAAVAGILLLVDHTRRLRAEVNEAKALSELWERRYEDEHLSAIAAERRRQEAELQRDEQLRALEKEMKQGETQRARTAAVLGRQAHSGGSLPLFILTSVRGGQVAASGPVNPIPLPRSSAMFGLLISLEGEKRYESYRVRVEDDRGRHIWSRGRVSPTQPDFLSIILNTTLFKPGHYLLIVHGIKEGGGSEVIDNYPFVITKAP
ncbi:MAG TPA: hypothetical protein VNI02_06425 [Blastocatellia bacterium]|jgi:hypothetical protein|nr:hypothetical protein [Blastocatellia bacterium]